MDTRLAKTIGEVARAARRALGLTQEDAADRVGISPEFYARIERGGTLPSVPTLVRMAAGLSVDTDRLLGRVGTAARAGEEEVRGYGATATESPEVRRLVRRLRQADARTVRLLSILAKELVGRRRQGGRGAARGRPRR